MSSVARDALVVLWCALIASCIPALPEGGTPRDARRNVPGSYGERSDQGNSSRIDWRDFFADPNLVALIDSALENNQELNILVQESLVANNEIMALRGEYLPRLGIGAEAGIERVGTYTSQGQNDEQADVPEHLQGYRLGLFASWEIDVWGRLHDAARAGVLRYLATIEGRRFMETRIVAEIASSYYELLGLDAALQIVRDNIQLLEASLQAVRLQQQAARVSLLAVRRFEALLRGVQSEQFDLQQEIVVAENRINFLVGRFPQHVERSTASFMDLQPPAISLGTPQQLLANRPDVRQAELQLEAAELDVSVARAAFYPSLSLDANFGVESYDIRRLVTTPDSILYNLFANVMAPLLNRSGITANYYSANSRQMQAVLEYERRILTAYIDVSNSLSLLRNMGQSYVLKRQQVDQLQEAIDISNQLFNSARADYLEVLTTRRDYVEAQMDLIETKQRWMSASVALYQALGGGWRHRDEDAGGAARTRATMDAGTPSAATTTDNAPDAGAEDTSDAGAPLNAPDAGAPLAAPDAANGSPDTGALPGRQGPENRAVP